MAEIRTPKGKLYGKLDTESYILSVIDGKNERRLPIPKDGCRLWYTSRGSPTEEINIPPQQMFMLKNIV